MLIGLNVVPCFSYTQAVDSLQVGGNAPSIHEAIWLKGSPMTEGVEIQALFEENGDKTNFTFNCVHPTEEYCKQQEKMGFYNGWGSVFDRLNEYLQEEISLNN